MRTLLGLFKIPSEYAHYESFDLRESPQEDIEKPVIEEVDSQTEALPAAPKKSKRPKRKPKSREAFSK
jgi:hypothetical protein